VHLLTVAPMRGIYLQLKSVLQCTRVFYIKKISVAAFSCSIFVFLWLSIKIPQFFLFKKHSPKKISLCFHYCELFSELLPAAPAATLAASVRPSLPTVGTTVAAARIAAHWSTSPLGRVVKAGSSPTLWRRELAREPERRRRRDGSGRRSWRPPFFLAGAGAGTIDSSLVLLFAGSPSSPPLTRSA
jgi:hypothetical protein